MAAGDQRLWTEAGAAAEYMALLADPVNFGAGVARGKGEPVLVIPGLFGNDAYLTPLRSWLRRVGYTPIASSLTFNAGCSNRIYEDVRRQVERALPKGEQFIVVGHSRGGILGWATAAECQERVVKLILVGSPAPAVAAGLRAGTGAMVPPGTSQRVVDAGLRVRQYLDPDCDFPACECEFVQVMRRQLSSETAVTCIVSDDDPVVPVSAARLENANVHHVRGTHSGLVVNRAVYRLLGEALAARPGK
jgi:pimeloyl-ACP methyl ester carboxylesterase